MVDPIISSKSSEIDIVLTPFAKGEEEPKPKRVASDKESVSAYYYDYERADVVAREAIYIQTSKHTEFKIFDYDDHVKVKLFLFDSFYLKLIKSRNAALEIVVEQEREVERRRQKWLMLKMAFEDEVKALDAKRQSTESKPRLFNLCTWNPLSKLLSYLGFKLRKRKNAKIWPEEYRLKEIPRNSLRSVE